MASAREYRFAAAVMASEVGVGVVAGSMSLRSGGGVAWEQEERRSQASVPVPGAPRKGPWKDNPSPANPVERSRPRDRGALRRDRLAQPEPCTGMPAEAGECRRRVPKMVARPRPLQGWHL